MKKSSSNKNINKKGLEIPSYEYLKSLYHNLIVGIYRTTPEGKILLANPALIKMLGFESFNELMKRNLEIEGFNSVDSRNRFKVQFKEKDEISRFEAIWQKKDGSHIFVLESARAVRDNSSNIIYYDGTVEDITYLKKNEFFLKENEEKYRDLIEEDLTADFITGIDGKLLLCNTAFVKMFGFKSKEDAFRTNVVELYTSKVQRQNIINQLKQNKKIELAELKLRRRDGKKIIVLENIVGEFNSSGELVRIKGYMFDITDRKKAENELLKSEERFRRLAENADDLIYRYEFSPEPKFTYVSPAATKITGFTPEDHYNDPELGFKLVHPDDRHLLEKLSSENEFTKKPLTLRWVRKDGKIIWTEQKNVPIYNTEGKLIAIEGIARDVTDRKEMEDKYRQVIENASEFIFITDANGNFTYANEAGLKASGYTLEEVKTFNYLDLVEKSQKREVALFYNKQRKNKQPESTLQFPYYAKSGEVRWLEQNVRLTLHENEITGYHLIARDITERKLTEKQLHDQTKLLTNILNILPVGLWITDRNGKIVHGNPAGQKIWSGTKYVGIDQFAEYKGWWLNSGKLIEPEEWAAARAVTKKETSLNEEIEIECFDGTHKIILNSAVPIIDSKGEVTASIIVNTDITERKRSELELKESEAKFRVLTETTSSAIFMIRGDTMIYANPASENLSGYSYNEIMKMDFWDIIHPDNKDLMVKRSKARQRGEDVPTRYEIKIVRKDGSERWVDFSVGVIKYEGKSTILGTAFDITDRKIAEEEIKLLSQVVNESPVATVITDPDGNIEYTNPKFTELTGYSAEEVKGQNPRILKSGLTPLKVYEELWETLLQGKVWKGEIANKNKSGNIYFESNTIVPIKNGKLTHYVALKEDITEKKKMVEELVEAKERAEESNKLKSEFLAQMSHEIRTPINIVIGNHSLIREFVPEGFQNEFKDIFDGIESSSRRIIRTIDLILNVAEMHSGKYEANFVDIDLDQDIFSRLINEFRPSLEIKGLILNYENRLQNSVIKGDEYSIMQIFANLLDNAIKYTREGSISIKLNNSQDNQTIIEVIDSGIGMSGEFLKNLFQPFNQEEKGYSRTYEGNGLGLSLVKEYCNINNAVIEVESKKNFGSTFRVIFN